MPAAGILTPLGLLPSFSGIHRCRRFMRSVSLTTRSQKRIRNMRHIGCAHVKTVLQWAAWLTVRSKRVAEPFSFPKLISPVPGKLARKLTKDFCS